MYEEGGEWTPLALIEEPAGADGWSRVSCSADAETIDGCPMLAEGSVCDTLVDSAPSVTGPIGFE